MTKQQVIDLIHSDLKARFEESGLADVDLVEMDEHDEVNIIFEDGTQMIVIVADA